MFLKLLLMTPTHFVSMSLSIFLLSSVLLLSGCEKEEETSLESQISAEENLEESIPQVDSFTVLSAPSVSKSISVSGTLAAKEEVTVSSEASGRVAKVLKEEGENVKANETILTLEANTNLLNASYSAALAAFHNSSSVLSLTKQSAERDIANAKVSVEQARIAIKKIENSKSYILASSASQRQSSEKTLEISNKNLKIAQTALEQVKENEEKIQKNLLQNTSDNLSKIFVDFRAILRTTDDILGASETNKDVNNEFEVYLEGTSKGILLPTKDLWKEISRNLLVSEELFKSLEKKEYNSEDEAALLIAVSDAKTQSKEFRVLLRNIENMLNKSIVSSTFSQATISSLKDQNRQQQLLLESNLSSMTALEQSLSDYHIQSPQRITNATLNVSVAESQVASSESNLANLVSAEGLTGVNQSSDIESAQQQLISVQASFDATESRSALSIQSANAQYDSARSALDQAEINLSKLIITSGVDGTISKILLHDGDTVSPGTPLIIVSDFSELKLEADISLEESFLLKSGMKALISVDGIEEDFEGVISLISPQADKITRRVSVEITVENTKNIPANIFAAATIALEPSSEKGIFVPNTAIVSTDGITSVYVITPSPEENGKYSNIELRVISLKDEDNNSFSLKREVVSGLSEGEKIIMDASIPFNLDQKVEEKLLMNQSN